MRVNLEVIKVNKPKDLNVIIGQAHFIKTVEDIFETLIEAVPLIKFGVSFCEASGKKLIRTESNDEEMEKVAIKNALNIGCGHMFFIALKNSYPINVLNRIKQISEVCTIFCATANSLEVIVAATDQGRSFLGVVDGASPCGVEGKEDIVWRRDLLRKIGYKK